MLGNSGFQEGVVRAWLSLKPERMMGSMEARKTMARSSMGSRWKRWKVGRLYSPRLKSRWVARLSRGMIRSLDSPVSRGCWL